MRVIEKDKKKNVGSISVGDTFKVEESGPVYMKISIVDNLLDTVRDDRVLAVALTTGYAETFERVRPCTLINLEAKEL